MLTWFSIATVTVLKQLNRDTLCQISMLRSFTEPEEVEVAAVPDGLAADFCKNQILICWNFAETNKKWRQEFRVFFSFRRIFLPITIFFFIFCLDFCGEKKIGDIDLAGRKLTLTFQLKNKH